MLYLYVIFSYCICILHFNVDKYKTKLESNLKVGDIFTVGEASGGDGEQAESSETGE